MDARARGEERDLYRDVLVHDIVEAGFLPDLAYELLGLGDVAGFGTVNFTAFNHFLLIDVADSGRTTDGPSAVNVSDSYILEVPIAECATNGGIRYTSCRWPNDTGLPDLSNPSMDLDTCEVLGGQRVEWCAVLVGTPRFQHDDKPGFTFAFDGTIGDDAGLGLGYYIYLASSGQMNEFCQEQLESWYAGADPAIGLWDQIKAPIEDWVTKNQVIPTLAAMCPNLQGFWSRVYIDPLTGLDVWSVSDAMLLLGAVGHSTITDDDVHDVPLVDIRWHPADNLAVVGSRS